MEENINVKEERSMKDKGKDNMSKIFIQNFVMKGFQRQFQKKRKDEPPRKRKKTKTSKITKS
jgi:hypothetical protein